MASSEACVGPTKGRPGGTTSDMRETCEFAKEHVLDEKIDVYFDCGFMNLNAAGPAALEGTGIGTPVTSDVGGSLILSLLLITTDSADFAWDIPDTCDVTRAVDFRVLWSDDAVPNAANTADWVHRYRIERAGTDAEAVAITAFSVNAGAEPAPADTATADVPGWSGWNTISAGVLSAGGAVAADDRVNICIQVALVTLADASLYKGQVRFRRRYI
jgi:hypothetical protein